MRVCELCGEILQEDEFGMCDNCKASILLCDDIEPNIEDSYD